MSKIIGNSLVKGATGIFGDDMVYRRVRGKLIMAKPPAPATTKERSARQKAHTKRFRKAVRYANKMLANTETLAEYQAGVSNTRYTARLVAMSDFFNAPEIESINTDAYTGAIGDAIIIEATDDFKVNAVTVSITGSNGVVLEQGAAETDPYDDDLWIYKTTAANAAVAGTKITVTATDKPRNVTKSEKVV